MFIGALPRNGGSQWLGILSGRDFKEPKRCGRSRCKANAYYCMFTVIFLRITRRARFCRLSRRRGAAHDASADCPAANFSCACRAARSGSAPFPSPHAGIAERKATYDRIDHIVPAPLSRLSVDPARQPAVQFRQRHPVRGRGVADDDHRSAGRYRRAGAERDQSADHAARPAGRRLGGHVRPAHHHAGGADRHDAALRAAGAAQLRRGRRPPVVIGLTALLACGVACFNPALAASIGGIVPRVELAAAVALNILAFNVARSLGPAVGGAIVAVGGAQDRLRRQCAELCRGDRDPVALAARARRRW